MRRLILQREACPSLSLLRRKRIIVPSSPNTHPSGSLLSISSQQQPSTPAPPSSTTADAETSVARDKWRAGELATPPRPIFPWRHEVDPLPRLVDRNGDEGGVLGPGLPMLPPFLLFYAKHLSMWACGAQLNIPWYQRLLSTRWKRELAEASGWAFSQAVAGVLSNTYRVNLDDIVSSGADTTDADRFDVSFDHVTKFRSTPENEDICPNSEYMTEEHLRHLYEAAHDSGKEQMRILLQTKPVSTKLESLLLIPFLTRDAVKESPALRHTFRNMALGLDEEEKKLGREMSTVELLRKTVQLVKELASERVTLHPDGYGVLEGTIIAQVLVHCDEVFAVKDLRTDQLVQGDGQRRIVPHLVRLEMTVETHFHDNGPSTNHTGSWQITDWDDLLGGNLWYV